MAVLAPADAPDRGGVALQRGLAAAARDLPHPHRLVTQTPKPRGGHPRSTTRSKPRRCGPAAWPRSGRWRCPTPEPSCHSEPETTRGHPPLQDTLKTASVWPCKRPRNGRSAMSQTRTVLSLRPRNHAPAIPAPCHAQDRGSVALKHGLATAAGDVPHPHRIVMRSRRQRGRPSPLNDTLQTASVWPSQRGHATAAGHVPHPHRLVIEPRRAPATIAAPRHAQDRVGVALQRGLAAAAGHVPHPYRIVTRARSQPAAVARSTPRCKPRRGGPSVASHRPLATSHTRIVLSLEPEAAHPSPLARPRSKTRRCGPERGHARPLATSHTRTVWSTEPDAAPATVAADTHAQNAVGVALERAPRTAAVHLPHPHRIVTGAGRRRHRPRARHAQDRSEWPASVRHARPLSTSHTRTVLSRSRTPARAGSAPGHAQDLGRVAFELGLAAAAGHLPQPHRTVIGARGGR